MRMRILRFGARKSWDGMSGQAYIARCWYREILVEIYTRALCMPACVNVFKTRPDEIVDAFILYCAVLSPLRIPSSFASSSRKAASCQVSVKSAPAGLDWRCLCRRSGYGKPSDPRSGRLICPHDAVGSSDQESCSDRIRLVHGFLPLRCP